MWHAAICTAHPPPPGVRDTNENGEGTGQRGHRGKLYGAELFDYQFGQLKKQGRSVK